MVLGQTAWKKLIRRTCHLNRDEDIDFMQARSKVLNIVELLKSKEDPLPHLMDLLDLICERLPCTDQSEKGEFVRVSCPRHGSHSVGLLGFQLLEAAEAALQLTEQRVELVVVKNLADNLLAAVASRLARQQDTSDTKVEVGKYLVCKNKHDAIAISSLMQSCQSVHLHGPLFVPRDIGKEGWGALRKALSWRLHDVPRVETGLKNFMTSAEREDLRAIWDCLSLSWAISCFFGGIVVFQKASEEEAWQRLEEFLDLTDDEWGALNPGLAPFILPEDAEALAHPAGELQ